MLVSCAQAFQAPKLYCIGFGLVWAGIYNPHGPLTRTATYGTRASPLLPLGRTARTSDYAASNQHVASPRFSPGRTSNDVAPT